jgi:hypothetical protein
MGTASNKFDTPPPKNFNRQANCQIFCLNFEKNEMTRVVAESELSVTGCSFKFQFNFTIILIMQNFYITPLDVYQWYNVIFAKNWFRPLIRRCSRVKCGLPPPTQRFRLRPRLLINGENTIISKSCINMW